MTTAEIFVKNLKIAMQEKGITADELAEKTQIPKIKVDKMLSNKYKLIRLKTAFIICITFDIKLDFLLGMDTTETKNHA